ncbi:MAG: hypothetical protein ACODAD_04070, partial [Planctomycetota bacterium]
MVQASLHETIGCRILMDITGIEEKLNNAELDPRAKKTIAAGLKETKEARREIPEVSMETFKTIMPLNELHRRVLGFQAALCKTQGHSPLILWQSPLWDQANILDDPPKQSSPKVAVHLMRKEYRAGCFSISNASGKHETARITIAGLPGGVNPGYIT